MTTLQPMYTGAVGSPTTLLAATYTAGTSTQITLIDASVMPDASASSPNYITIRKPDASGLVTVKYTSKSGNIIGGLTVIEAYPSTGLTATYPIGSTAARKFNNADHAAFVENIGAVNTQLETHAARHTGGGADPLAVATPTTSGLESASDKSKLDGLESMATHNPIVITGHSVRLPLSAAVGERWLSKEEGEVYKIFTKTSSAFFDSGVLAPVGWYITPSDLLYHDGVAVFSEGDSDYLGYALATKQVQGHMSAEDKTKLDGIETAAEVNILDGIRINGTDVAISGKKSNIPLASTTAPGAMSAADKSKIGGIELGAEVNIIETIQVNGVALTPSSKTVDIPQASSGADGVMARADKSKLDGIAAGAQVNVLDGIQIGGVAAPITSKKSNIPPATASALGVVKVGAGLDIDTDGKLSVQQPIFQGMHGLKIDWGNSNPNTNLAYTLMSSLRAPATTYNGTAARDTDYTGDWNLSWLFDDDQRYWVLLHNITSATAAGDPTLVGTENYRLDPNNIFQKLDGTSAVLDGSDGDVMVCRRCMWDKYITGTGQDDDILVSPGKPSGDIGWYARAFEFEGTIRDRVYMGVFHATRDSGNGLRSACNYATNLKPLVSTTIGNFETYATNNNPTGTTGYTQWNVNVHDMMQILFWLKYRSTDSQTALGYGYCSTAETDPRPDIVGGSFREYNATDETPYVYGGSPGGYDYGIKTGVTNPGGTNGAKVHMRFDGIDDLWGNVIQWCKGATVVNRTVGDTTKYWVKRAGGNAEPPNPASWQEATTRYLETDYTANTNGYYSKVSRNPLAPLQGISFAGGSTSKFVCDYGSLYSGCVAYSGGDWAYGLGAGVSRLGVSSGVSGAYGSVGGRLLYYPPELADM